jgi:hypothetical protein
MGGRRRSTNRPYDADWDNTPIVPDGTSVPAGLPQDQDRRARLVGEAALVPA